VILTHVIGKLKKKMAFNYVVYIT